MEDARFADAAKGPLNLAALDPDDLVAISALVQDAVFPITEMAWRRRKRSFALLLNRFRWEDRAAAEREARPFERVRAVLAFDGVLSVKTQGIDRADKDTILSLLAVSFAPADEGAGTVLLTLAGDGAIRLEVEALDATLKDVTRPYLAPSRKVPAHP
jgi:Protein of unknown function (DUF2948)